MADNYINGVTTGKAVVSNNQRIQQTGTRDGAAYSCEYILGKAIEGKLFTAQLGTLTTPVTFRVAADADQPEMTIDVPLGTTIIPVSMRVHLEDSAGTDNEIVVQANPALCGAGTSTAGTVLAHRLNSGLTSACIYRYTYSGNCTLPANVVEFWRDGNAFADSIGGRMYEWNLQSGAPVVLVGPASIVVYIDGTGTAPAGYAKVTWMEFASADL
jgi:hypothetical protein